VALETFQAADRATLGWAEAFDGAARRRLAKLRGQGCRRRDHERRE
jgi:hypothetical protein